MATITVKGEKSFEASEDQRLVNAIEDADVDILHRCGGWAGCTTCRVEFEEGEPDTMTKAEAKKLVAQDLLGKVRLSCQILCDHDMTVKPLYRLSKMPNMDDAGPRPEDEITPSPAEFVPREDAQAVGEAELEAEEN